MDSTSTAIMICILVLIIYYGINYVNKYEGFMNEHSRVPKVIYSYWSTSDLPKVVKLCMESWRKYNPNYAIVMMNKSNYSQYVNIPKEIAEHPNFNDCPQHFADLLRLFVIAQNGGVWCDASILMYESLDNILPQDYDYELFCYILRPKLSTVPVLENWFFSAPPNSPFIVKWRNEFVRVKEFSSPYMYTMGLIFKEKVIPNLGNPLNVKEYGYLAMHMSAQKILQGGYNMDRFVLHDATTGPFKYSQWWGISSFAKDNIEYACKNPAIRYPMMKMTRKHRPAFEKYIDCKECKWV